MARPTEALVDALCSCRLIVPAFLFVALCFSRITMPKVSYRWKGNIMTNITYDKDLLNRKVERKEEKLL
jgi:hypothetical protein